MQIIKITDVMKKRGKKARIIPLAINGARVKVLATGCVHCRTMRDNTVEAVRLLGLPDCELECISDIASIAQLGIMSTPSLIIDGKLVSSGKVLSVEQIMRLICESNADDNPKGENDS